MITRKRINGFTLIEMLIAMTLLGILVALLFGCLKIAAESWNAGERKIIEVNNKAVVYQFFKRHITTIRPITQAANPTNPDNPVDALTLQQGFRGEPQKLRFVAALPLSSTRKGLQVFEIAANNEDPTKMMVSLTPYVQTSNSQTERVVLVENVKAFIFAYFGKTAETGAGEWQSDWLIPDRLPQLIKVSIRLADDSYWPDMVIPLKISEQPFFNSADAGN